VVQRGTMSFRSEWDRFLAVIDAIDLQGSGRVVIRLRNTGHL
jgi:hypothetical protein